jgi:YHS domain-containing protein
MKAPLFHKNQCFALYTLVLALALIPLGAAAAPTSTSTTYPLDKCIVSGETLGEHGDVVIKEYDGREVRFCCKMCVKDFEKDPASFLKKLDDAIIEAQLADYPAETCPISGQKLGAMGEPYNFVHEGRLVRLCCGGCLDKFNNDPATAMAAVYSGEKTENPGKCCSSGQKH